MNIKKILIEHKKWIDDPTTGLRANLRRADLWGANLQGANLQGVNLQGADLWGANLWGANLQGADLRRVDLRDANLQGANLQGANLQGADLRRANLDFSCLPLWCGSKGMKVDEKIAAQLALHFIWLDCDGPLVKEIQEKIRPLAEKSHRFGSC